MSLRKYNVTGTGILNSTLAPGYPFNLVKISLHLSAAGGSGNFTVTSDSLAGVAYDTNYITQDMTTVVDYVKTYGPPMPFVAGDEVDFFWTNASGRTYGLEVLFQQGN